MEDEEGEDENCLIEELSPTLHGESENDIATAVHSIFDCCLMTDVSFHGAGAGHGIFAADTDRIEHQRKGIHDNPTLQRFSPHGCKQNGTDKHNDNILN